jgi:hypothetical protein
MPYVTYYLTEGWGLLQTEFCRHLSGSPNKLQWRSAPDSKMPPPRLIFYNLARPVRFVSSLNVISFGLTPDGPVRGCMPAALYTASITPAPIDHEGQVVMVHLHLSERV